ncbi:MAG: DUF4126 domain-containing protein [Candidatus Eremiobacteraeota bacterium]|nr:DUF4126 domain-containing protein [Candidatus Eremiobacteraeota bacterium]
MEHLPMILIEGALGFSLAACAGLRAFLPLFVIGVLSRTGALQLGDSFTWIGSTHALIAFGTATVIEVLGDKFPAVDNVLDSAGLIIKPVAGTLLFSAVIVKMDPLLSIILGIIAGGSIAELIHVKKAAIRLASSGLTGGIANPFISCIEDIGALAGTFLSYALPLLAVFLVTAGIFLFLKLYRRSVLKRQARAGQAPLPAGGAERESAVERNGAA